VGKRFWKFIRARANVYLQQNKKLNFFFRFHANEGIRNLSLML
jgi:hypothetical protein